jgi:hypothetical protein
MTATVYDFPSWKASARAYTPLAKSYVSLDEMAEMPVYWSAIKVLVTTEQIPHARLVELCRDHKALAAWLYAEGVL